VNVLKSISAYFKSTVFLHTLLLSNNKSYGVFVDKALYDGLDGNSTPYKHFKPKSKPKHTLIIYPGASHSAEDHENLQTIGLAFARIGYDVYVPRIPPLKQLSISGDVISWMSHFYAWFINNINNDPNSISIMGVSFGGAMVLKTSLSNAMQKYPPKSLFSYGTYYQFETVIEFLYSGNIIKNGKSIHLSPDYWALICILFNFLPKVNLGYNTENLVKALKYHIYEDEDKLSSQVTRLSIHESKIWDELMNNSPSSEVKNTIDIMFKECREEFIDYSPQYWCNKIDNRVFILHGTYDNMVPYTESVKLGNSLKNSRLHITDLYGHKEISFSKRIIHSIIELYKVLRFLSNYILETFYVK